MAAEARVIRMVLMEAVRPKSVQPRGAHEFHSVGVGGVSYRDPKDRGALEQKL